MVLTEAPLLAVPDFSAVLTIEMDAYDMGIGAVLIQESRPINYLSKPLSEKHKTLSIYEKEMSAIVLAIVKWRPYLLGRHFKLKTDHHSLKCLLQQKIHTSAQQKWLSKQLGYDF